MFEEYVLDWLAHHGHAATKELLQLCAGDNEWGWAWGVLTEMEGDGGKIRFDRALRVWRLPPDDEDPTLEELFVDLLSHPEAPELSAQVLAGALGLNHFAVHRLAERLPSVERLAHGGAHNRWYSWRLRPVSDEGFPEA